jgi:hypothetical protein
VTDPLGPLPPTPPGGLSLSNRFRGGRGSSQFEALGPSNRASRTLPQATGRLRQEPWPEGLYAPTTTGVVEGRISVVAWAAFGRLRENDGRKRGDEEQQQPPIQDPRPDLFEEVDHGISNQLPEALVSAARSHGGHARRARSNTSAATPPSDS